ncbi:hypothetical protein F7725_026710 [Dissostichus mawsoni]|uniref:Complement C1q tumor necrosis factor-related protein 4 n=1 Tax=Dissostichus mawsoni TaxID=36200 RepID=A0A7J5X7V6_DISMA|nr:hypothetical protein F7725_026710 [Dissostichus mawsoni]
MDMANKDPNVGRADASHLASSDQAKSYDKMLLPASVLIGLLCLSNAGGAWGFARLQDDVELRSAFSVARTNSMEGGPKMTVTFDAIYVNIGGDFDPKTGLFRCRITGAYFFSFTVGKFPHKDLSVMLMKNRNEVQAIVYEENAGEERKVQSQSVMLQLEFGDTVWLRLHGDPRYALYSNTGHYTTFNAYYFSFNVGKMPQKTLSVKLMKNHLEVQAMIYDDSQGEKALQSQSLMLSLKLGEIVWLYSHQKDGFGAYSNHAKYITFTGFLVYPDLPDTTTTTGASQSYADKKP